MKKSVCIIICAVGMLSLLCGCGKSDSSSKDDSKTDSTINGIVHDVEDPNKKFTDDNEVEIDASELNGAAYGSLLVDANPMISSRKTNYEYMNTMHSVKQLRRVAGNAKYCYCKFINMDNDSVCVYVFFERSQDYETIGAIELSFDSSDNTALILNNVGDISESLIDGIAKVDLPFGASTVLYQLDSIPQT